MPISTALLKVIVDVIETTAVVFTATVGFYKYKKLTVSARALIWMVIFICLFDYLGDWLRDHNFNTAFIFSIYAGYFLNVALGAVFFNYCIPFFRKIKMGIYFALIIVVFLVVNMLFVWPAGTVHTGVATTELVFAAQQRFMNFVAFYTLCSIILELSVLFILFRKGEWPEIRQNLNFWLVVVNLFMDGCVHINSTIMPLVMPKDIIAHADLYNLISTLIDFIPGDIGMFMYGVLFLVFTRKKEYSYK